MFSKPGHKNAHIPVQCTRDRGRQCRLAAEASTYNGNCLTQRRNDAMKFKYD
jgi:hypothetical protein